jgi:hypothetical protein
MMFIMPQKATAGNGVVCPRSLTVFVRRFLRRNQTNRLGESRDTDEGLVMTAQLPTNQAETTKNAMRTGTAAAVEHFLVQCDGFRCLAVRNADGKWFNPFSKQELPGVLAILEAH